MHASDLFDACYVFIIALHLIQLVFVICDGRMIMQSTCTLLEFNSSSPSVPALCLFSVAVQAARQTDVMRRGKGPHRRQKELFLPSHDESIIGVE